MNKPLEGLFVVELTTYWAAPSAGEFLRCLGARVVKIETGKAGDSVRYWGRTCGMPIEANENPSFDLFNGGKEFMHMDLNDPEHERVLHNMLAKADVFLTSMRLGGLKKHNLDYDTLKEKYPRLVMAHATGYGCKDGPLSAAPGLDAVAFFAMNGLISDLRLNPDEIVRILEYADRHGRPDDRHAAVRRDHDGAVCPRAYRQGRLCVRLSLRHRQLGHIRDQLRHAVLQPLAALPLHAEPHGPGVRDEGRQVRADLRQ